ncbi:MAG: hypothetical protein EBQ85_07555 [Proteobacteria bacterium]|nr:hypothetical protein [Pseudomonadota bacterium]
MSLGENNRQHSISQERRGRQLEARPESGATKPNLVYLSSQKNKIEDPNIAQSRNLEVSRLEACGFDVRDMEIENLDSMNAQLSGGQFPADTPIFVSASHGAGKANSNTFQELRIDPKGHDVSAPHLIKNIRAIAPRSSIYLDVCHAGLCRDGNCDGVGTSCGSNQQSGFEDSSDPLATSKFPVSQALIDLYCDSIQECSEFKKFDENGNKILEGREINQYMAEKFGSKEVKSSRQAFKTWPEAREGEKKCKATGNRFRCHEALGNIKVSLSKQTKRGSWVPLQNLRQSFSEKKQGDIDTGMPMEKDEDYSHRDFSPALKMLLTGKWPGANTPGSAELIKEATGISFAGSYQVSDSGKELYGRDVDFEKDVRLRLDKVSEDPDHPLIECECLSNDVVPSTYTATGKQQIYFDPSFQIRCRSAGK